MDTLFILVLNLLHIWYIPRLISTPNSISIFDLGGYLAEAYRYGHELLCVGTSKSIKTENIHPIDIPSIYQVCYIPGISQNWIYLVYTWYIPGIYQIKSRIEDPDALPPGGQAD